MTSTAISFVSLGPGEAELITLKGWKALQNADVIFCPATRAPSGTSVSHAARILRNLEIAADRIRLFTLPMSKKREEALQTYDCICEEARQAYQKGMQVCIVAEGDAGFYASIHYIYEKLRDCQVPVHHIPGIPAFIGAGALAGLHLASGTERLSVIPGIATSREIEQRIQRNETVVIMKLSQCTEEIHECLRKHPEYQYHYFEKIGTEEECYLNDIPHIEQASFPYFSLMVIRQGETKKSGNPF